MSALPTEKMKDYLSSLNKDIALTTTVNFCGDQTVNAVLNTKILKIKDSSINFHYYLEIPNELPYEKTDVCALFSNMMDNAIEACEKIASKDKEITLDAKVGKGLLAIKIENTCVNTNIENNKIKTTKLDAFHHGYGLKSIQEIVTRYHGNYELKCVNNHFFLFLYIPI